MSGFPVIAAYYAPDYCVPTRSGSMEKLAGVAAAVAELHAFALHDPGVIDLEHLFRLHEPDYVRAFLDGTPPLARSQNLPWSEALRSAVLAMQAGQLHGAEAARRDGIAFNIANGFHHARYERGGGFCTFNGLALVAHVLWPRRVAVLDCDQHGGNGTEDFAASLDNLYNYSIFGMSFGCQGGVRSIAARVAAGEGASHRYFDALDRACTQIRAWVPELLIYQAGVDCHVGDPLGRGPLTESDLAARDRQVFEFCRSNGIPVLVTLAGGYQSFARTIRLHQNSFEAAAQVYSRDRSGDSQLDRAEPIAE